MTNSAEQEVYRQKILKGIAGHKDQQNLILEAIKDNNNALNQDKFDEIFDDMSPINKTHIWSYEPDSFLLGDLTSELSKWVHLTKLMVQVGKVNFTMINGKVVYSVKLEKPYDKNPTVSLKYIELPFSRIKPYIPGVDPFDFNKWPNEPNGFIKVPVVITPSMTEDEILHEALNLRDNLINKWYVFGKCLMEKEEKDLNPSKEVKNNKTVLNIKPCPFCGGKATLLHKKDIYVVGCLSNDCPIKPMPFIDNPTRERAIEAWNTRWQE